MATGNQAVAPERGVGKMKAQVSEPGKVQSSLPGKNSNSVVLEQLKRIKDSHAFCNSPRAKEFLSYVVEHGLEGHTELLKERSIGVNLFRRAPTYFTSDDPIVRVKAAEVRRRLAQYYAEEEQTPEVRIEIPVGSYIPKFQWPQSVPSAPSTPIEVPILHEDAPQPKRRVSKIWMAATVLAILGVASAITLQRLAQRKSPLDQFWEPVFATSQPVLICLPSPVGYALSTEVYARAGVSPPKPYDSHVDHGDTPIQPNPNTLLKLKDLTQLADYFVNKDDAYVATDLAGLFARLHKGSQVRIGRDFTYEDLRSSPVVLIGAFDNVWTTRVTAELPFVFREQDRTIVEQGGKGRSWRMEGVKNHGIKDFAIVARVLNSKTGQFLVVLGGIGMVGTQAAGAFISEPGDLDAVLRNTPRGWQRKNIEMVIETDVIDGSASRPHVVAFTTW